MPQVSDLRFILHLYLNLRIQSANIDQFAIRHRIPCD